MKSFLEEVSLYILENHQDTTGDLCIVTPNRRAGLFLQKHIAANVSKPIWAPEVLSIEDFINKISELAISDKMGLLFEFYRVYRELEKDGADDIDTFFSWAPTLLSDFDDIDNAMAKREKLYGFLGDIRYIDTWNPDGSPLTEFQQNYLDFIRKLGHYHEALASHMTEKGMAWQGLSSRKAADIIEASDATLPWKKIIFAGFNALTQAEESIIHTLLKEGRAEYIADSDPYYEDDESHEAGRFIRKYRKKFSLPVSGDKPGLYAGMAKKIRILGIAKNVNQARLAGNLLKQDNALSASEQTAVVLANESLLVPTLNALPSSVNEINVTMGYPIEKTNMFRFFDSLFHLFLHGVLTDKEGTVSFYHKDLHRLFSHSLAGLLWDQEKGIMLSTALLQKLAASNKSFCTFEELTGMSTQADVFIRAFGFLQTNWQQNTSAIFPALLELAASFDSLFRDKAAAHACDIVRTPFFADFESLYYFAGIFRRLQDFLNEFPFLSDIKTLYRMLRQAAAETRLAFLGEPLQGLQVMGMLETRSLDFKNVVLLSANEKILPKPRNVQSFIPFEVKKAFGLRLYQEQDAVYAYHFYRLLQRAENIYLIYNTQSEDIGSSEKSRFLTQLQYELPRYNPETLIREDIVSLPPQTGMAEPEIVIRKTDDIVARLHQIAKTGFSPSALSRYVNCPLQFYLEKVVGLDESDAVEETMEAATIGSVVHSALEMLYTPYVGKVLNTENLQEMKGRLEESLRKSFQSEYIGGNISSGKNLLLYHLVKRYIENQLNAEKQHIQEASEKNQFITVLALESKLKATLRVSLPDGTMPDVLIKGLADRIDRVGNVVRVIDYKTGRIGSGELSFREWDEPFINSDKAKNFQLLCYAWMYHQMNPDASDIEPGIISTRTPAKGSQTMKHPGGKGVLQPQHFSEVETALHQLIREIMDESQDFTQTPDVEKCKYCNFKVLCGRYQAV